MTMTASALSTASSLFGAIEPFAGDPILSLFETFKADARPGKLVDSTRLVLSVLHQGLVSEEVQTIEASGTTTTVCPRFALRRGSRRNFRHADSSDLGRSVAAVSALSADQPRAA